MELTKKQPVEKQNEKLLFQEKITELEEKLLMHRDSQMLSNEPVFRYQLLLQLNKLETTLKEGLNSIALQLHDANKLAMGNDEEPADDDILEEEKEE